ncbi:hypothetical protein [Thiolinea disciformis]|uniref:hypothetical protein n=1 Tax=Thiolinea disciformis TaxID=125614 RepID=UPI000381EE25|nr:hypothetical protein [Thiolinea disciformis]
MSLNDIEALASNINKNSSHYIKNINIDNTTGIPIYIEPFSAKVNILNNRINTSGGNSPGLAIYLDAQSQQNLIEGNIIKNCNYDSDQTDNIIPKRGCIAIDASSNNIIRQNIIGPVATVYIEKAANGNKGQSLIEIYRNCGENNNKNDKLPGAIRFFTASNNKIQYNIFNIVQDKRHKKSTSPYISDSDSEYSISAINLNNRYSNNTICDWSGDRKLNNFIAYEDTSQYNPSDDNCSDTVLYGLKNNYNPCLSPDVSKTEITNNIILPTFGTWVNSDPKTLTIQDVFSRYSLENRANGEYDVAKKEIALDTKFYNNNAIFERAISFEAKLGDYKYRHDYRITGAANLCLINRDRIQKLYSTHLYICQKDPSGKCLLSQGFIDNTKCEAIVDRFFHQTVEPMNIMSLVISLP